MTPAELVAVRMVAADPAYAREIAGKLALDLLEKLQAGRHVDPVVREFAAALLRALKAQPDPVPPAVEVHPSEPHDAALPASEWLSVDEVAAEIGCSRSYVYRLIRQGPERDGLQAVKLGTRIARGELERWQQRRRREPA